MAVYSGLEVKLLLRMLVLGLVEEGVGVDDIVIS